MECQTENLRVSLVQFLEKMLNGSRFDGSGSLKQLALKRHIDGTLSFPARLVVGFVSILWKVVLAVVVLTCISGAAASVLGSIGVQYPIPIVFAGVVSLVGLSGVLIDALVPRLLPRNTLLPRLLPRELFAGGRSLQCSAFQGWSPGTRIDSIIPSRVEYKSTPRRATEKG